MTDPVAAVRRSEVRMDRPSPPRIKPGLELRLHFSHQRFLLEVADGEAPTSGTAHGTTIPAYPSTAELGYDSTIRDLNRYYDALGEWGETP